MASIDFPTEPVFQSRGYNRVLASPVRRTVMEDGQVKQARRSQKKRIIHNVQYLVSDTELADFEDWFVNDAAQGAKFFDWEDPIEETTKEGRIVDGLYTVQPISTRMNYYLLIMQIEVYE